MTRWNRWNGLCSLVLVGSFAGLVAGCEKPREKVLDIKAPGVNIEVERSLDGTETEIKTGNPSTGTSINIDRDPADRSIDVDVER